MASDLAFPSAALTRRRCLLIGACGMLVLSPDSLLLRLVQSDDPATIALRSLFTLLTLAPAIALMPALRRGFRWKPVLLYGVFYALGLACFPLSIQNTHVANTLVIISATPMLAAVGAHFILGERTRRVTWMAAAAIFCGMALIFAGSVGGDGAYGDFLALLVALSLAATSIIVRRYPETAVYPGLMIGGAIVALLFAAAGDVTQIGARDVLILAADGAIVMSLSFLLILTAARGLPPAELNLLFLLETLLGPLWVWLFLSEVPPSTTIAAGILIAAVLSLHTSWILRRSGG